jgi:hypothetical protein
MNNAKRFIGDDLVNVFGQSPMRTLSLDITPELIANSKRGTFTECMVAEALYQKYPDAAYVRIDSTGLRFTLLGLRYWFSPPPKVLNYIAAWDNRQHIQAFKFVATDLVRVTPGGQGAFSRTHPKGDNRTNPRKAYKKSDKKRNYGTKKRVGGICVTVYGS